MLGNSAFLIKAELQVKVKSSLAVGTANVCLGLQGGEQKAVWLTRSFALAGPLQAARPVPAPFSSLCSSGQMSPEIIMINTEPSALHLKWKHCGTVHYQRQKVESAGCQGGAEGTVSKSGFVNPSPKQNLILAAWGILCFLYIHTNFPFLSCLNKLPSTLRPHSSCVGCNSILNATDFMYFWEAEFRLLEI